jgi:hypothetical protein
MLSVDRRAAGRVGHSELNFFTRCLLENPVGAPRVSLQTRNVHPLKAFL